MVVDACHSGDATRGLADDEVVRGVERIFEAAKALVARGKAKPENHPNAKRLAEPWVTISACRSDEVNVEMKNPAVGKLTYALYRELQVNGAPKELPENKYYIFGKGGVKQLAEEMQVPLLGEIPLVQGICESGDEGEPAVVHSDTITGLAFRTLAEAVVRETERRNREQPPTHIVEMKK